MILKADLLKVAKDQQEFIRREKSGILRKKLEHIDVDSNHIIIISGIRRSGKSTLLKQIMGLVDHYFYFSFEDQRVFNFEVNDFEKLFEVAKELDPEVNKFFFDEVQNIEDWERFVRAKHDLGFKFYIAGSNATMISKDLGTKLTGRNLRYELFPFNYDEYNVLTDKAKGIDSFKEYMVEGGFPEYLTFKNPEILQHVYSDVISRDVIIRHKIKSERKFKEFSLYLLSNIGKTFSFTRLRNIFDLGATNTAISYVTFLEESYLLKIVNKFSYTYASRINSQKKIYAIDNGLINAISLSFSEDRGRMLENVVFNALNSNFSEVFYFREQYECDFVIREKNRVLYAIQVCYEVNSDNLKREMNGLNEALQQTKAELGLIITMDQIDEIENIKVMSAWKWLSTLSHNSIIPS